MTNEQLAELAKEFTKQGKLIEAGWIGLRIAAIPLNAPQIQVDEMREAFFAGAQYLFGCIMHMLDPDLEPTNADIRRMISIDHELRKFLEDFKLRHAIPACQA